MSTTSSPDAVTSGPMLRPSDVDEAAYAKFLTKITKSNMRARDKSNASGRGVWVGMSDADCAEAARSYCIMYRHQFRVLVPVVR